MIWVCDICGSSKVSQEWATLLPMNEDGGWEESFSNSFANDFYWCEECDEECSPVRKQDLGWKYDNEKQKAVRITK